MGNKKDFVLDEENEHLINYKSLRLIREHMTRFGEIKPRKYTGITVKQQKRMKKAISRARQLGLVPYIK